SSCILNHATQLHEHCYLIAIFTEKQGKTGYNILPSKQMSMQLCAAHWSNRKQNLSLNFF
ncbi:MAG: hypothetical protein LKM45_06505, partial [Wolbachia endosymbiont of Alcedoecus sp.]|nr:hypothetical protein [Wolbachia endosymbiont of Alcedoecus sp.]